MYHGFRLNLGKSSEMMTIFKSLLTTCNVCFNFGIAQALYARALPEIELSQKPNYHRQVKLVEIPDTHSRSKCLSLQQKDI